MNKLILILLENNYYGEAISPPNSYLQLIKRQFQIAMYKVITHVNQMGYTVRRVSFHLPANFSQPWETTLPSRQISFRICVCQSTICKT